MKAFIATLWILIAALAPAQAGKSLERINLAGVEYVRLRDWGNLGGFKLRQTKDKVFELTSSSTKLVFTLDSNRAEMKDITVFLSMPVQDLGGAPLVSLIDLQTTIQPILYPERNQGKPKVSTICLDPGHGGRDTGEISAKSVEKKYTLLLADEVAHLLKHNDFKVVMTRTGDDTIDLSDRPAIARQQRADLFVSLHYNAAPSSDVCGGEVYCMSPSGANSTNEGGGKKAPSSYPGNEHNEANVLLGFLMQKSIVENAGLEDRGLKRSRFAVLKDASMPAILVEAGFMSNPAEARNIYNSAFRKKMAQAIVDGILNYKRIVERQ